MTTPIVDIGVLRIATAPYGTALPALPDSGSSITWSSPWVEGNIFFTEDDVQINGHNLRQVLVFPPRSAAPFKRISNPPAIDNITLTSYEVGDKPLTLATNAAATGNVWKPTQTHTAVAFVIEVLEVGLLYFKKVEIDAPFMTGGNEIDKIGTAPITIIPFRDALADITNYEWHQYPDAS